MKLKLLSCILTLCFFGMLSAQNYPVTVVPQAVSPSPIYFSSYADAGTINSPLRVQILLNDITLSNVEVRLKTYFEGNGIRFESNNAVVGANPIYLEGGVPVNLTNIQLAPFYSLQNISGINSNQYAQPIPEGSYQFCFEVYDAFTGNRLSARSCATTYIFKNEPPFLVLPRRDETIDVRNPQNIVFQWTPRHINVSNVEYEFSIVEIWDHYVDPQAAFFSMPPIFQANTRNTSYLLGPADPMLLPNKKYAWRVQAKAISGTEEIGLFNNNGYSEIFWFNHSQPCEVPANVRHEVKGTHQANIEWDDFSTEIPEYKVRYREKNSSPSGGGREGEGAWFYSRSNTNWTTIWDLRPGTIYEYQVNRKCQLIESEYSPVKTFTTFLADDESGLYNCGITPEINITNTDPLPDLFVNNVFKAGDFPIKVLEVSGSNGRFTGKGYVSMPYLKNIKVAVEFTNVLINTDKDLIEGMVITVYDPKWGGILNVDGVIDVVDDVQDVFTGGDNTILDPVDYDIDSITVKDGQIVVTGTNGEQTTYDYDEGDTYQISGANGVYAIDKNGNVSQLGETAEGGPATAENTDGINTSGNGTVESPSVAQVHTEGVTVTFRKGSETETKYELDMVDNSFEQSTYPKAQRSDGTDYYPVHKAVVNGTKDVFYVDITVTNNEINIDSLVFKTVETGLKLTNQKVDNDTYKIEVEGKNAYRNEEAIITYKDATGKQRVIASFFIHHLHKLQTRKVQIVSVNGAPPIDGLEETLETIFGVAGASFDVNSDIHEIDIDPSVWDIDENNGVLDYNGSGLLPDYPKEIRAIHQHYMANTANYDSKAYYLFLVDKTIEVSKPINGFMPKSRQFGYIFNAHKNQGLGAKDEQDKVAAHELGHGVFSLEHPFESDSNAGNTEWLMDYKKDGIQLPFMHWAVMSDTGLNLKLFQPDEGGELAGEVWFTPKWEPITIKGTSKVVSTPSSTKVKGTLPGFRVDGIRYTALFDTSGNFSGYYEGGKVEGEKYNIPTLSHIDSNEKVYLFVKGDEDCDKAYETTYSYVIQNKSSIVYSEENKNIKDSGRIKCANCAEGQQFLEDYINTVTSKSEKEAIQTIAGLICAEGDEKIDYKLLVSQIYKNNADYVGNMSWLSDKAMYRVALDNYWNPKNEDAFKNYLSGLQLVSTNINKYNEKLGEKNVTKEDLYAGIFYLNDDFLSSLEFEQKKNLLKLVFDNNTWWIGENIFDPEKSDRALIRKLIKSVPDEEIPNLVKEVGTDSGDRDRLIYIGYELTIDQFELFSVEDRLNMLSIILDGIVLDNWSGTHSTEDLVLNIIDSVVPEDANAFLEGLVNDKYKVGGDLLYKQLVDKLDNSFIGDDTNRLSLITKLANLSFVKNNITNSSEITISDGNEYNNLLDKVKCKASYYWNVRNERFLWIFNVVKDESKLEFSFIEDQKRINLRQECVQTNTKYSGKYSEQVCVRWTSNNDFDPFELVALDIINDITFTETSGACNNNGAIVCGKVALVPAMFIDYLIRTKDNARIQNGVFNTLTIASFYFSGASIIAARGAFTAATFTAYADIFVTVVNPYFSDDELFVKHATSIIEKTFNIKKDEAEKLAKLLQTGWTIGTLPLTIDTATSIPNPNKHIEAIATYEALVKRVGRSKAKELISADAELAEKTIRGFEKASAEARQSVELSKKLDDQIEIATKKIDNIVNSAGNSIADIQNTLLNLLSANSNLRKSIGQLNVDADFNQTLIKKLEDLNVSNGKGGKLINDFDQIVTEVSNPESLDKLLDAWHVLKKASPQIASIPENSKILAKVADRFAYRGEDAFAGLNKLFNEGSEVASKQKLINGLKEADQLFDEALKLPIQFSAIKKGEVTVNVVNTSDAIKITDHYGSGEEVARYIDGILQKKKVIPEGEGVKVVKQGITPEDDILHKGDEVGFRAINGVNGTLEDLLQNPKFKEIYEGFINKTHIQFYKDYGLTEAEEAAYKLFIGDSYYSDFNKALAGTEGTKITPEYAALKKLMESAYSKLPKIINKRVYRGAGATESIFAKRKKIGDEFDFEGRFTSSSIDDFTADNFRRIGKGDVIWQILSKTGVDLRAINKSEAEVLFKPFTKYKLMDIKPSEGNPDVLLYIIIEL